MRVALVYNQKKEDATQQSLPEDTAAPPSTQRGAASSLALHSRTSPSTLPLNDLYAEWDTAETIEAVASALSQIHHVTLIEADGAAHQKLSLTPPEFAFNIREGLRRDARDSLIPSFL